MARACIVGSRAARPLGGTWEVAALKPGQATEPGDLDVLRPEWVACDGPLPVAAALRAAGQWSFEDPRDFDAEDWWYRCRFSSPAVGAPARLRFEGLATVADVWLNGAHILRCDSMFVVHTVDVTRVLRDDNELTFRFHALGPLLASPPQRPRPRWRTGLVERQALRWYRTSLLGRMTSWCPPVAPVGPWRPISIETSPLVLEQARVSAELAGDDGLLRMYLRVRCPSVIVGSPAPTVVGGTLTVGACHVPVACEQLSENNYAFTAAARLSHVDRWWPHTHGAQPMYAGHVSLTGDICETIDFGRLGFRSIDVDRGADGNGFGLVVNGTPMFCRGVCWTPLDLAQLSGDRAAYRSALEQLRTAGVNMVRIGGTMAYETDRFHDLCDELGILVWQDFMFANMDYPWQDQAFADNAAREVAHTLEALQARPSLAVVCGSSETDQQPAMLGLPRSRWSGDSAHERLPGLVRTLAPEAVWLPTTPTGGTFPFQVDSGVSHYYGVGAYRRPFEDARRARVRFAAECLAFSNVPDRAALEAFLHEGETAGPRPRWKSRVPRDTGATWDFEDIRDHYVEQLFGVRAAELFARDPERYLALGRVATGEAMLRTFSEWRRPGSTCRGALVWFARDFWPGAGWGIIDSTGRPKAPYWYLKRALARVALFTADEGLNGLWLHAVNDTAESIDVDLRVALYLEGRIRGEPARTTLHIPPRASSSVHADALFDGFLDLTYAYRFGSPGHDVVASTLRDCATGTLRATACYFPGWLPAGRANDVGLTARAEPTDEGYSLVLDTARFAHAVAIEVEGFLPDDNYLNVEPGETRRVALRRTADGVALSGAVSALNGAVSVPIMVREEANAG